jgi:hypothetical protein
VSARRFLVRHCLSVPTDAAGDAVLVDALYATRRFAHRPEAATYAGLVAGTSFFGVAELREYQIVTRAELAAARDGGDAGDADFDRATGRIWLQVGDTDEIAPTS